MLNDIMQNHQREYIYQQLRLNLDSFDFFATQVNQEDAQQLKDGSDGWTVLEIMAHLRDIEETFLARVQTALKNNNLAFPGFDQLALVKEKNYNDDVLVNVVKSLKQNRQRLLDAFHELKDDEWSFVGWHSKRGATSIDDLLVQTALHDAKHIRQLSRIFAQKVS